MPDLGETEPTVQNIILSDVLLDTIARKVNLLWTVDELLKT